MTNPTLKPLMLVNISKECVEEYAKDLRPHGWSDVDVYRFIRDAMMRPDGPYPSHGEEVGHVYVTGICDDCIGPLYAHLADDEQIVADLHVCRK